MQKVLFTAHFIALFILVSCGGKNEGEDSKTESADSEDKISYEIKKAYTFKITKKPKIPETGDILELKFGITRDSLQADSIKLYVDNTDISTFTTIPDTYTLNTKELNPGKKILMAMYYTPKGRINKRERITLVSNITPVKFTYSVEEEYPHDVDAFTQGLTYHNGYLYESTGKKGQSSLRKIDLPTGSIVQSYSLPGSVFGEGMTIYKDKIVQLTWHARKGYVFDLQSFNKINEFNYSTEGWGITTFDNKLVMSDGTNVLYFRNPETYATMGRIEVHDNKGPVDKLNGLEAINGKIYANVYQTDKIVKIQPYTGKVVARINLEGILSPDDYHKDIGVLNGIAYDEKRDRILVTGKNWPKLYHINVMRE